MALVDIEDVVKVINSSPVWTGLDIIQRIKTIVSIDIVQCKECKFKRLCEDEDEPYYYCALEDRPNRQWSVDDDDYCSYGERKSDEQ